MGKTSQGQFKDEKAGRLSCGMRNPSRRSDTILSLYGNVAIKKTFCSVCKHWAFVLDGKLACCGLPFDAAPEKVQRESEPPSRRKTPSKADQAIILREQDDRCIYCCQPFGQVRHRHGRKVLLRLHWDHASPFVYAQDNSADNFVAACHVCNGVKSDLCFGTLDEAMVALLFRRQQKGYDF